MIKNYAPGSDITLLNTIYRRPQKDSKGKWDKGSITLIYRDNKTGLKHNELIEDPSYEFYFAKEEVQIDHHKLFIEKDKVDIVKTSYNDLEKTIAELTGNVDFYYDNIRNGNRYANKQLHTHPRVFMSDMNIEDFYRFKFSNTYTNESYQIKKTFFDIEADTINMRGDFPELGECPINAVTAVNEFENKVYTFLLRNPDNPLIEEFEKSICPELFDELKEFIRNEVHGWKNEIRFGLDKFEYEFLFYDEEIKLIQDLFKLMNVRQPDFVLAWNMKFDIPYIIERIKALGYRPEDIMCHPDFKEKAAYYYVDTRNENDNAEKGDYAVISSYSVYIDQLIQFASRRKGRAKFDSMKLDLIGKVIAGVNKLDYSDITLNIAELPYKNYKVFVFYNIMDTIVQKCIETKVADMEYIFNKCLINNTRYPKGHRQTVYLVNRGSKEFYNQGLVIGNNANKRNEKVNYPGAFVADSKKLNDYSRYRINGSPVTIYNNCDDFDYKSLYPSQMREFNMAPNTQIGKVFIPNPVYSDENPFNHPMVFREDGTTRLFDRGGAFLEDLQSQVYLEFGRRWLHLADYKSLYKDVAYFVNNVMLSTNNINVFNRDGLLTPVRRVNNELNLRPVSRTEGLIKPINRFYKRPDCTDIKNINVNEVVNYE